jgi:LysM repeat protein
MDLGRNWVLLRTLIIEADVQVILVDKAVQNALYDYALSMGEDQAWLDAIFRAGKDSKVQHAKRHKDHFHARLFAPRSQELGRRVQPILNKRPEENIIGYRIRNGDNLGKIAKKHGVTVAMIQKANGMRKTQIRAGRTLRIPLRGPCTHCPIPPPLVLPPRCLPPVASAASAPSASPPL